MSAPTAADASNENVAPCPICLDPLDTSKEVVTLSCGHGTHAACWIAAVLPVQGGETARRRLVEDQAARRCPLCRSDYSHDLQETLCERKTVLRTTWFRLRRAQYLEKYMDSLEKRGVEHPALSLAASATDPEKRSDIARLEAEPVPLPQYALVELLLAGGDNTDISSGLARMLRAQLQAHDLSTSGAFPVIARRVVEHGLATRGFFVRLKRECLLHPNWVKCNDRPDLASILQKSIEDLEKMLSARDINRVAEERERAVKRLRKSAGARNAELDATAHRNRSLLVLDDTRFSDAEVWRAMMPEVRSNRNFDPDVHEARREQPDIPVVEENEEGEEDEEGEDGDEDDTFADESALQQARAAFQAVEREAAQREREMANDAFERAYAAFRAAQQHRAAAQQEREMAAHARHRPPRPPDLPNLPNPPRPQRPVETPRTPVEPPRPPVERHDHAQPTEAALTSQLDTLAAMGFLDRDKNIEVLRATGTTGDLHAAVSMLLLM